MDGQPIANHLCEVSSAALIINLMETVSNWSFIHIACSVMYRLLNGKVLFYANNSKLF